MNDLTTPSERTNQKTPSEENDLNETTSHDSEAMTNPKDTQLNKLKEIRTWWKDNKLHRPMFRVYDLKEAQQFADWKFRMRVHIDNYELDYLLDTEFEADVKTATDFVFINSVAINNIGMNLTPELRTCVSPNPEKDLFRDVWQRLITRFEGTSAMQTIRLFARVQQLLTNPSDDLVQTVHTIREVKARFDEITPKDKDALWKAILNRSIPEHREGLRAILSSMASDKSLDDHFDTCLQSGQMESLREDGQGDPLLNKVGSKNNRSERQDRGHQHRDSRPKCFFCHKEGHQKKQCRKYQAWLRNQVKDGGHSNHDNSNGNRADVQHKKFENKQHISNLITNKASTSQLDDDEIDLNPLVLKARLVNSLRTRSSTNSNPIDESNRPTETLKRIEKNPIDDKANSEQRMIRPVQAKTVNSITGNNRHKIYSDGGANRHYLNSLKGVRNLRKDPSGKPLYTASGEPLPIEGIGTATIYSSVKQEVQLRNAVVCVHLTASYISESILEKKEGYEIRSARGRRQFYLKGKLMMVAEVDEEGLYEILGHVEYIVRCNILLSPSDIDRIIEWHDKLSHVNLNDLRKLEDRLDISIPNDRKLECPTCIKAKAIRLPFSHTHRLSKHPLDLVHTDLSGIIRIPNKQRYRYFLLLIDDYSRHTFVYLLRSKDEVSEKFKEFKLKIELQIERQIKKLKSDGGTEFRNQRMTKIATESGMEQIFSAPRCPQQNGGPERLNRTIETMARCMLIDSIFGTSFWPFAVLYAVFVKNRLPHSAIGGQIPLELFYDILVNYDEIKKFGCRLIYLIDDMPITKFDPKGEDGLFLGYPPDHRAVYVYSLQTKKVIIRRHVYFLTHPENQIKCPVDLTEGEDKPGSQPLYDYEEAEACLMKYCGDDAPDRSEKRDANIPKEAGPNVTDDSSSRPEVQDPATSADEPAITTPEQSIDHSKQADEQQIDSSGDQQNDEDSEDSAKAPPIPTPVRPATGETIQLTADERIELKKHFPDLKLQFARPVRLGGGGGAGVYKVNSITVPKNYNQIKATRRHEADWRAAVDAELSQMEENRVWIEVDRPKDRQVLPMTWVFKVKYHADGTLDKFKARLCVLGNLQRQREDRNNYAPVLNELTLRSLLAFGVNRGMYIEHVDVCSAYLHADITEEVYVEYPAGMRSTKGKCLRLRKSVYGLPSSALAWYNKMSQILLGLGFKKSKSDRCVFIKKLPDGKLGIIGLYVDDLAILGDDRAWMDEIKSKINEQVTITDKGTISHFLNLEIHYARERGVMSITQRDYIAQTLEAFGMIDCNTKRTPSPSGAELYLSVGEPLPDATEYLSIVGRLIYLSTHSRPDIKFIVSRLCQFGSKPTDYHLTLAKHVLRYLKTTMDYAIYYTAGGQQNVVVNCDADFSNDKKTSRSITGVTVQMYSNLVNWESRKQDRVCKATCQSEVFAIDQGLDNLLYVRELLNELVDVEKIAFRVYSDNTSAIATCKHGGDFGKNKSYRIIIHRSMELLAEGWATLSHKPSGEMEADLLTKPLTGDDLKDLLALMGVF